MSDCKFNASLICFLELRVDMVLELYKIVPEWITIKELAGKGKILKFAPQVNAFKVTQQICQKTAEKQS